MVMVIPIPERIASQGPPTTTEDDHLWWEEESSSSSIRAGCRLYAKSLSNCFTAKIITTLAF